MNRGLKEVDFSETRAAKFDPNIRWQKILLLEAVLRLVSRRQKVCFPYRAFVAMRLQHNKVKNLTIASRRLNGLMVKPGETFSFWRRIGNPTRRKGYVEGMVLFYGNVTAGVGGGLCQLSNLIYWMALHTPLTVTERHRHSYDVFSDSGRTQPFGSGATCAYNYLDLQIKNETDRPYQLIVYLTDTHLVGEWRSTTPSLRRYEVYEKEHFDQTAVIHEKGSFGDVVTEGRTSSPVTPRAGSSFCRP